MYSLYLSNKTENGVEETLIYDARVPDKDLALISPSLEVESGNAGSLDFTMPPNHLGYNLVDKMRTEVIFKQNDKEMWRGRVLNTDTDFYNQMKVECEGELAYLNDTYQPQKEYDDTTLRQFLEGVISIHNQKVSDTNGNPVGPIDKRFKIGAVYVEDVGSASVNEMFRKTDYNTTLECLKSVANTYKAYFVIRKTVEYGVVVRYLDFVKDFVDTCSQSINFGENLLDYSKSFTMEDLCTVAMPIGAKMEDKAGEEITLYDSENNQPINYIYHCNNQDDLRNGHFGYDPNDGNRYARVCYLNTGEFQTGDKIYVSVAQSEDNPGGDVHKDGIWCFADANGSPIFGTFKYFNSARGEIETYEKYELTIPAGAHRLRVGGYVGLQPEIKVYRQKAKERVDECYTISSVPSYDEPHDPKYPDTPEYADKKLPVKHNLRDIYVINKALFEKYGWHEKKLSFGDLDNSQKLNDMAVEYLTKTQFEQMKLDLTAFDLSTYNMNYEQIWINMNIPFYSPPHGIAYGEFALPCTKMTIKLDSPEDNEYTLGYSSPNQISDTQTNVSADISHLMEQMPAVSATLASAKDNALQLLNAFGDAGYVTFEKHENSNDIQAIIISNAQDPNTATKRWIWNQGGFAYQERATTADIWPAPDVAITMDGEIVADRVTTGTMYADRIRGGDLILGTQGVDPSDQRPGSLYVYDGTPRSDNRNRMASIEKDWGITSIHKDKDQYGEYTDNGWFARFRNGQVYGGWTGDYVWVDGNNMNRINEQGEACSGRINFLAQYRYSGTNTVLSGVDMRGDVIGLNCFQIWVSRGLDGPSTPTFTGNITIGDVTLDVVNGLIVGHSNSN